MTKNLQKNHIDKYAIRYHKRNIHRGYKAIAFLISFAIGVIILCIKTLGLSGFLASKLPVQIIGVLLLLLFFASVLTIIYIYITAIKHAKKEVKKHCV
ncbi:hypothetical protein OZX61_12780 (plasmid) [Acinetobacter sp. ESL0695]|uniref:hypothetical protein n=1 Tax=Acinetobacter sp. ESL0695 TaxID=2983215 RepID=UPI0023F361E3|nr:hypothetical protein [Acinetobacter sp. ESL0695]WEV50217.1 hypothetical protein OZX61_12780 [Acinetobacter sp. ESL0695]